MGHFLKDDIAGFDAPFFGMSSTDAACADPQGRLLLESTYRALENGKFPQHENVIAILGGLLELAGMSMKDIAGSSTSVYTGVFTTDWQHLAYKDGERCGTTTALGVQACMNANRISWFFNLLGKSANIDTACSSSLVCLDLACQGLRSGEECMVSYPGIIAVPLYN